MFKRKIKQFICALLAVSLLLVNKGMYTGCEVHAETGTKTYEEDLDKNYEKSIVSYRETDQSGVTNQVKSEAAKSACIWEKNDSGRPEISYIGNRTSGFDEHEWIYDIIKIGYENKKPELCIVNVRPADSKIDKKIITLPTCLTATINGQSQVLKCVELADKAFFENENIEEVKIPNTYQRICAYAFKKCKNLQNIHFVTTKKLDDESQGNKTDANTANETVSGEQNLKNSDLHFLGTGAFAGCTSLKSVELPTELTEGYRSETGNQEEQKDVDWKYATCGNDEDGKRQVLNENASEIGQTRSQPHFMGQGVFRDCCGLKQVIIDGNNPYIPALTYYGCTGIGEIIITDTVENIYFGALSFAESGLKKLNLNRSNLKNVIIGAYAFKNCKSLNEVNITANLNQQRGIYNLVQGSRLFNQNAFENAFAHDIGDTSSFTYAPKDSSEFVIPAGFFKTSNVQKINFGGQLQKNDSKIYVNALAFMRCPCSEIVLDADTVVLYTGSLYSLGKKNENVDVNVGVTIQSSVLEYYGEPLANPKESVTTASTDNEYLNKIYFDSKYVRFYSDGGVDAMGNKVILNPSFYGAPSNLKIVFSEKLSQIDGCIGDNYIDTLYRNAGFGDLAFDGGTGGIFYEGTYEEIKKRLYVGIAYGCSVNRKDPSGKVICSQDPEELAKIIYADGKLKEYIKSKTGLKVQDYTQIPANQNIEFIYDKNHKYNTDYGIKHAELIVRYADNPSVKVPISYEKNEKNGFKVVTADWESNIEKIDWLDISYRGQTTSLAISKVAKRPTSVIATAVTDKSFLVGEKPKLEDFKIDAIQYNDETKEDCVEDKTNFSVSVPEGVYKQGENTVTITYSDGAGPDVTTTCKVVAEGPKVTSLTDSDTTATNTAGSTNPSNVTTSESASNTTTVTSLAQLDGNTKRVTIGVGEKIALLYIENVTYTTSNAKILSVNHNIVTGKKVGKASVTLKDTSGNTKTYVINVKKAPKKLMLKVKKTIKAGKTAKIQVSFPKGSYSYIRKFASSNKKIAMVDQNGVIHAKSKGTCTITVKTYNNKKATIKIKVK